MKDLVRHLLDVGAGGEGFVGAGDDDAADIGVGLEGVDRGGDLGDQRGVERIERLRPVEPDDADLAARLDDDVLVGHGRVSGSMCRICLAEAPPRRDAAAGAAEARGHAPPEVVALADLDAVWRRTA